MWKIDVFIHSEEFYAVQETLIFHCERSLMRTHLKMDIAFSKRILNFKISRASILMLHIKTITLKYLYTQHKSKSKQLFHYKNRTQVIYKKNCISQTI